MDKVMYQGLTFVPYISKEKIAEQVSRVAAQITGDCKDAENPLFVVVLNGSFMFAADLFRACRLPQAEITFIRYKSYSGTGTTGEVKRMNPIQVDVKDRDVIIVEDIVDTGITASKMVADMKQLQPRSIRFATLLYKPSSTVTGFKPDYYCFDIPSKFILGYGLDLDEKGRYLDEIYILDKDA